MRPSLRVLTVVTALILVSGAGPSTQAPAATFDAFVDEFLETLSARHPSIAAGNGLHAHDGELEDFSAGAIDREIAGWRGLKTRLGDIPVAPLSPDRQVDHRIVDGLLDAWLLDLQGNQNWRKNPMMTNGIAPWWAHRRLLLAGDDKPVLQ